MYSYTMYFDCIILYLILSLLWSTYNSKTKKLKTNPSN